VLVQLLVLILVLILVRVRVLLLVQLLLRVQVLVQLQVRVLLGWLLPKAWQWLASGGGMVGRSHRHGALGLVRSPAHPPSLRIKDHR
jgi:hypothetical protein